MTALWRKRQMLLGLVGGRCEACEGQGIRKVEMSFLPDTYVPCEECAGTRYGSAAKAIRWNGKSAAELLAMTFEEAAAFRQVREGLGPPLRIGVVRRVLASFAHGETFVEGLVKAGVPE